MSSLGNKKARAVFLDRDGVIIKGKHHLVKTDDVEFIRGAASAIKKLNRKFLVVVVSNQSVVARGLATASDVEKINAFIKNRLAKKGARIDAFYFCPHHPGQGPKCDCRKPGIGMLLAAKKDFGMDFMESFFVGDKTADIQAGKNAGCRTVLVLTGYAGKDGEYKVEADFEAKNLPEAAAKIMRL